MKQKDNQHPEDPVVDFIILVGIVLVFIMCFFKTIF